MRRTRDQSDSRGHVLRDLWMKRGCPEKMTIHVKSTGETIVLINGLPLEPVVSTTDKPCAECGRPLPVGKPRFCSVKCGMRFHDRLKKQRRIERADDALSVLKKAG